MPSFSESIDVDGNPMGIFLSVPSVAEPFPGVVVCHDGAGVDKYIREVAQRPGGGRLRRRCS